MTLSASRPRRGRVDPERWRRYRARTTPLVRRFHRDDLRADPGLVQRHMRRAIDGHRMAWDRDGMHLIDAAMDEDWVTREWITVTITARPDPNPWLP